MRLAQGLVLLANLSLYLNPAIAGDSPSVGGGGGLQSFRITCPNGQSITSIRGRWDGQVIKEFSIGCSEFDKNSQRTPGRSLTVKSRRASSSSSDIRSSIGNTCGNLEVAEGFIGRTDRILGVGAKVVTQIQLTCDRVGPNGRLNRITVAAPELVGAAIGAEFSRKACPRREVARGIFGKFGTHLDNFGLVCGPLQLKEAAARDLDQAKDKQALGSPGIRAPVDNALARVGTQFRWTPVNGARSYKWFSTGRSDAVTSRTGGSNERVLRGTRLLVDSPMFNKLHDTQFFWSVVACGTPNGTRCSSSRSSRQIRFDSLPVPVYTTPADTLVGPGSRIEWQAVPGARTYRFCFTKSERGIGNFCTGILTNPGGDVLTGTSFTFDRFVLKSFANERIFAAITACGDDGRQCGSTGRPGSVRSFRMRTFDAPIIRGPESNALVNISNVRFAWNTVQFAGFYKFCLRTGTRISDPCATQIAGSRIEVLHDPGAPGQLDLRRLEGKTMYWSVKACATSAARVTRCGPESQMRRISFTPGRTQVPTTKRLPATKTAPSKTIIKR